MPTPLEQLRAENPWPTVHILPFDHGWLRDGTKALLARYATGARVILELGVWLGRSTRYLYEIAPGATVISVDTWNRKALVGWAKAKHPHLAEVAATARETFVANAAAWGIQDRVICWKKDSVAAVRDIAKRGIRPDLVYLDTAHTYEQTVKELAAIRQHLPGVLIVGDDWDWTDGVGGALALQRAVKEHAAKHGQTILANRTGWALPPPGAKTVGRGLVSIPPP